MCGYLIRFRFAPTFIVEFSKQNKISSIVLPTDVDKVTVVINRDHRVSRKSPSSGIPIFMTLWRRSGFVPYDGIGTILVFLSVAVMIAYYILSDMAL
jgi:hypothetical protein